MFIEGGHVSLFGGDEDLPLRRYRRREEKRPQGRPQYIVWSEFVHVFKPYAGLIILMNKPLWTMCRHDDARCVTAFGQDPLKPTYMGVSAYLHTELMAFRGHFVSRRYRCPSTYSTLPRRLSGRCEGVPDWYPRPVLGCALEKVGIANKP